ncbi:isoprenoid synthase domain-containing protein [Lentinula raphanica]|nr:isoprenoid synthase domain-containing protein [Lentinula raphanica]KAJ3763229.1 isoprenoid synthase domain-containing protein [Lentinula raphanica]KAJ3969156.1 isoprenoid synthase domain-containing protein [Lentinula raphanica]
MSSAAPTKFILPDLVSDCPYPLHVNRHRKQVTTETKRWLFKGDNLQGKIRERYHGLKCGTLAAMVYPRAAYPQLRVCNDFLTYLFHLDNLSDDMDNHGTMTTADVVMNSLYHPGKYQSPRIGKMTRDYWTRLISTASPRVQQRFMETLDFFFQSVTEQANDRQEGAIPDLESYIALRRDTSGCKTSFVLIEYSNNLDIPDEVMEHPLLRSLNEAANDLVTWSNDIFSYNVEQSKGDTHNMIPVIMNHHSLDLQPAVDYVGQLCNQSIERFMNDRAQLPSWGPEIDRQVQIYVDGLEDWMSGSLHWSFESERYFGKAGRQVKKSRVINLLPKRA